MIKFELSPEMTQFVLDCVAQAPYRVAAPVMETMRQQIEAQVNDGPIDRVEAG
tara:strand:- start:696 stop:854 length:159 start_codon:yes stop_codon:yes gene_type:complete